MLLILEHGLGFLHQLLMHTVLQEQTLQRHGLKGRPLEQEGHGPRDQGTHIQLCYSISSTPVPAVWQLLPEKYNGYKKYYV